MTLFLGLFVSKANAHRRRYACPLTAKFGMAPDCYDKCWQ